MPKSRVDNRLKRHRKALGFSQQELADLAGVSRQSVAAIEAGRSVPSARLGLQLAHALGCGVEDLFQLAAPPGLRVRWAAEATGTETGPRSRAGESAATVAPGARVAMGRIAGRWVGHRLPSAAATAADGIVLPSVAPLAPESDATDRLHAVVRPLTRPRELESNVLVAGCAPLLGPVAHWTSRRYSDARVRWLRAGNRRALELLAAGLVHVAGLHLSGIGGETANLRGVRRALPGRRLFVANLTRWRQGIVVAPGNPLAIAGGEDLFRPGVRLARRERGSGADALTRRLRAGADACESARTGPMAAGHEEVAWTVGRGLADAGIAIEAAALAEGLDFVPITQERFDLVVPAELADRPPVSRLLQVMDDPGLRAETAVLPGYDVSMLGQVATVEVA